MRIQVRGIPSLSLLSLYVCARHLLEWHFKVANEVVSDGALELVDEGQEVSQHNLLLFGGARLHRQVEVIEVRFELRTNVGVLCGRRELLRLALLVLLLVVDFAGHLVTCIQHVNRE